MSTSHHGYGKPQDPKLNDLMNRFLDQAEKVGPKREYPNGRLGGDDDGALVFAVATDPKTKTVIVNFNKSVKWFGMTAKDAAGLANLLLTKAREIATEPLTVEIG